MVLFNIVSGDNVTLLSPEAIGSYIVDTLRRTAESQLGVKVNKGVISVPAEFEQQQRNFTRRAAQLAGWPPSNSTPQSKLTRLDLATVCVLAGVDIWRVINEPTAAALAYGLHKHDNISNVLVVDLGGGTLDVSLLHIQGGMFLTQAMSGSIFNLEK